MVHRKEEYQAAGHNVVIQQSRGTDSNLGASEPSAWIDGKAAYTDKALEYIPVDVSGLDKWNTIERLCAVMVDKEVLFCKNCNTFYDYRDSSSTGFAGHQCDDCARAAATCSDNPDGNEHEDECLNSRQKNNARVPTKYKCTHCGRKRSTTPTG
jgi:hypothetical protein